MCGWLNGPAAVTEGVTKDVSQAHKQILIPEQCEAEGVRGQKSVRGQFLGSAHEFMGPGPDFGNKSGSV